jgi:hypothetical protein
MATIKKTKITNAGENAATVEIRRDVSPKN